MAEDIGIVMSLYDKLSPTMKTLASNTKAFDKNLDELEASLKAYEKSQESLVKKSADYKKALTESNLKVADATKAYKKLKDEASKGALNDAIDDQTKLKQALKDTEIALAENSAGYKTLIKNTREAGAEMSKVENRAGGTGGTMLAGLKSAGLTKMLGDSMSVFTGTAINSLVGQPMATLISSILSSAATGAALGGVPGAVAGGVAGLISGGSQAFSVRDDAFKAYVEEQANALLTERASGISTGSGIAAQRELDAISFNKLLGDGVGTQYLSDLRVMAAKTPMEYSDLTSMSRSLATGFGDDTGRMLDLMEGIGNAGSAVGTDASGMNTMAQALSRMQSSNKASLEYLNMFQERGVDVIGMLAEGFGTDQAGIYSMISKGALSGTEAVDIIQKGLADYGGAMDEMSKTYGGLTSTLADAQAEMDNAYGEGYNNTRKEGLQAEIDWMSGESGEAMQKANEAIGSWYASLENSKEEHIRDAIQEALDNGAQDLIDTGDPKDAAKAGRLLAAAKAAGIAEYNASDAAQEFLASENTLVEQIRNNAQLDADYWDAGYEKGQMYNKGLMAAYASQPLPTPPGIAGVEISENESLSLYAYGLNRVPYDGYRAVLHEGERVLTAREARQQDSKGSGGLHITVTGNSFGSGISPTEIAAALASTIERKIMAGVR